jgi:hypothetical protein
MRKLITIIHSEIRVIRITVEMCVSSTECIDLDIKMIKDRKIILRNVAGKSIFVWLRSMQNRL